MSDRSGGDRNANSYFTEISNHPQFTPEAEYEHFVRYGAHREALRERHWEGYARLAPAQRAAFYAELSKEARDRLDKLAEDPKLVRMKQHIATHYLKFVVLQAGKRTNNPETLAELISEGNIGLMIAIHRFDPDRKLRFLTYAAWWIESYMREYLNKPAGMHVPSHARKKYRKRRQDEDKLIAQGKLAGYTVEEPQMASTDPALLAAETDVEGAVRDGEFNPLRYFASAGMSHREKLILIYRHSLRGGPARTFRDLAKLLQRFDGVKLTSERIRQLQERAAGRLREELAEFDITATRDVY